MQSGRGCTLLRQDRPELTAAGAVFYGMGQRMGKNAMVEYLLNKNR